MKKKKVLIFIPSFKLGGGCEKNASNLSINLSEKYDVYIISLFHSNNLYPYRGSYFTLNENYSYMDIFKRVLKVKKIIYTISPDIIITYIRRTSFSAIILKSLFRIKIPHIIIVNTNPDIHYRKRIYGKILIKLLYPLKEVNLIVTVSKKLKEILINRYKIDQNKIITLYNGFDINLIRNLSMEKNLEYGNIFNDETVTKFITVGRISLEKGYHHLIKAFSIVVKEVPNSVLLIIGEGPLEKYMENLIKIYKLEKKVILLGVKNNPYKYLSKSDIFVLPSLHEGLPRALIEALICELPVISTDCDTGPREILEDGKFGLLVKVADIKDLAKNMINLAKNKDLQKRLSENAFKRAKIFNNQIYLSKWIKIIKYLIK